MKNWKIILTLWVALGVAVSGYFYIFPKTKLVEIKPIRYINSNRDYVGGDEFETKRFEVSILTTIVGSIIIFGVGKYYKKG